MQGGLSCRKLAVRQTQVQLKAAATEVKILVPSSFLMVIHGRFKYEQGKGVYDTI